VIGTALGIAGAFPEDPPVFFTSFGLSWAAFIYICIKHEGYRSARIFAGTCVTVIIVLLCVRSWDRMKRNERAEPALVASIESAPAPHVVVPKATPEILPQVEKTPIPIATPLSAVTPRPRPRIVAPAPSGSPDSDRLLASLEGVAPADVRFNVVTQAPKIKGGIPAGSFIQMLTKCIPDGRGSMTSMCSSYIRRPIAPADLARISKLIPKADNGFAMRSLMDPAPPDQ
jgi:hypothetical protein